MKLLLPLTVIVLAGCSTHQWGARRSAAIAGIEESIVRAHMEFLASDALGGRGSGTRDEWIAATYAASHMQRIGLDPLGDNGGYVQAVAVEHLDPAAPPVLSVGSDRMTHGREMLVTALRHPTVSGPLRKWTPAADIPAGAVVLMPADVPANKPPPNMGPAAVRLYLEIPAMRQVWTTREARLAPRLAGAPRPEGPNVVLLDKAAHARMSAIAEGTTVTFAAGMQPARVTRTWNAVGRLSGSDPARRREVILLSAHLDHLGTPPDSGKADSQADRVYNGADDDASGTVAVLALAEALAAGRRVERTIVFALFGSEESGGLGSAQFAERPPVALSSIVANLQFEMIGRPDTAVAANTLWLTGYERSDLGPRLARDGARIVRDPHPEQNFFQRSDNFRFAQRGVVAHTVSSFGLHKEYHHPSDDLRTIDFGHMTRAIRSMVDPVRRLANSTFKPQWLPGMKP